MTQLLSACYSVKPSENAENLLWTSPTAGKVSCWKEILLISRHRSGVTCRTSPVPDTATSMTWCYRVSMEALPSFQQLRSYDFSFAFSRFLILVDCRVLERNSTFVYIYALNCALLVIMIHYITHTLYSIHIRRILLDTETSSPQT